MEKEEGRGEGGNLKGTAGDTYSTEAVPLPAPALL